MKPRQRRHNRAPAEQQAARRWARAPVHTYRPECIESRASLGRAFANGRGEVISCKYNSLFSRVECRMSRYGLLSTFIQSIGIKDVALRFVATFGLDPPGHSMRLVLV